MTKRYQQSDFHIRAIEFGLMHSDGFSYGEILDDQTLNLTSVEKRIITQYLSNAYALSGSAKANVESLFRVIEYGSNWQDNSTQYTINLDSRFKYIDFQELSFARKNASEARALAILAIIVSAVIPIVIAWRITQTVKVDDGQIEALKSAIILPD